MTDDVDRLLQELTARWRAGERVDAAAYADRLDGMDRAEFVTRVDAYLLRAPRRRWDAEGYQGSAAERVVDAVEPSLAGVSGVWPSLLPQLRDRAQLTRRSLVDRLAEQLDVSSNRAKVERYYHQMEQGQLPASGVSQRVLDVLADILRTSGETLRQAGQFIAPAGAEPDQAAFARTAHDAPIRAPAAAGERAAAKAPEEDWDEVDQLFRSG